MTGPTDFDEALGRYLMERQLQMEERVDALLATMTKRERALVREVAVMASVQATMRAGSQERVPPDEVVLRDALNACLAFDDLYPAVARLDRRALHDQRPSEETT